MSVVSGTSIPNFDTLPDFATKPGFDIVAFIPFRRGVGRDGWTPVGPVNYGTSQNVPVITAACVKPPRKLIGTGGTIHGAQLPGR